MQASPKVVRYVSQHVASEAVLDRITQASSVIEGVETYQRPVGSVVSIQSKPTGMSAGSDNPLKVPVGSRVVGSRAPNGDTESQQRRVLIWYQIRLR